MDETDEIIRARAGDREAGSRLFSRHWGAVYAYVLGIVGDRHRAEDLTQQSFLRAWSRLPQLRDVERFLPWLRCVARSVALNGRRRGAELPLARAAVEDPARLAEDAEHRRRVEAAIRALPRRDRSLLFLVHLEELPLVSVSRLLEIPVTTLRRRLDRALARFERAYRREEGGDRGRP